MKKNYFFYIMLWFVMFVSCNKDDELNDIPVNCTIIVYMAADNDLSDDAWDNLKSIQSGYIEKGTNLIVFIDPTNDYPHIFQIMKGVNKRIKIYPEFNSVDAGRMRQVINDIIGMYPAPGYGLVLWSHGTSWLPAGVQLRSFGEDHGYQMDIHALADALPVKFDFILMDACLMGSVEVAYELRNKADFIIASPTETLYMGFPYGQIIPELLQDEPDLKKVATSYFNYYDQLPYAFRSASVSLINTSELEQLALITNRLISGQAFEAEMFDRKSVQRLDVYEEQYTFDFLDFIEKAFPDSETGLLKEQLDKTVPYKAHTPEFLGQFAISAFCGLSCYIPMKSGELNGFYRQLAWCEDSGFYHLFQ